MTEFIHAVLPDDSEYQLKNFKPGDGGLFSLLDIHIDKDRRVYIDGDAFWSKDGYIWVTMGDGFVYINREAMLDHVAMFFPDECGGMIPVMWSEDNDAKN